MNDKLKNALMRMGYREMGKDVWAKPFGFHILTVKLGHRKEGDEAKFMLFNYFMGANKELLLWDSYDLIVEDEDYLASIKWIEHITDTAHGAYQGTKETDFSFLTKQQEIEQWL